MVTKRFNLSLVVPAYNEEKRIASLRLPMLTMAREWGKFELIIVNDGSTDNTGQMIKKFENTFRPHIDYFILNLCTNVGKGGALKEGVKRANGDYILTLDADMSSEPTELIKWYENVLKKRMDHKTIYIGDRTHVDSQVSSKFKRKLLGNAFNFVVRKTMRLANRDTQCGFKLYPATLAKNLFSNLYYLGWVHDLELLYHARLSGAKIVDMPIRWTHKNNGQIQVWSVGFGMLSRIRPIMRIVKKRLNQ